MEQTECIVVLSLTNQFTRNRVVVFILPWLSLYLLTNNM
jgi:hypothetical protein